MSLAGWAPTSNVITITRRTPQWDEQFRFAAEQAYRELQLLNGRDYGVTWIDLYSTMDEIPPEPMESPRRLLPSHLRTGRASVPAEICYARAPDADRACCFSRRVTARLHFFRRAHRHPRVLDEARFDVADGKAHRRQLHRSRLTRSVSRRGDDADQRTADASRATTRRQLRDQRRCTRRAGSLESDFTWCHAATASLSAAPPSAASGPSSLTRKHARQSSKATSSSTTRCVRLGGRREGCKDHQKRNATPAVA